MNFLKRRQHLHALGDYVSSIWRYGPTDGYSTQVGELEHRRLKKFYSRTNKRNTFALQIAQHQQREQIVWKAKNQEKINMASVTVPLKDSERLPPTSPDVHYQMSRSRQHPLHLQKWLFENCDDPVLPFFLDQLKDHLLSRLHDMPLDHEYSYAERNQLRFVSDRIYRHKFLRINYTTYDMQRAQDFVNPLTRPDIMMPSPDGEHPYIYAHVLGLFHADVSHVDENRKHCCTKQMDFLWVRWYQLDATFQSGFEAYRLPRLEFVPDVESGFGFLDPNHILRASHLIPAFAHAHISTLGKTLAQREMDNDKDWKYHYANMFVDRDMFMRYHGGGVGHRGCSTGLGQNREHAASYASEGDVRNTTAEDDVHAEKYDYGYKDDSDEEPTGEEEEEEEDDMELGPEDGEDGWEFEGPENDGYGAL
ncbi:hypothetical protein NP233_g1774 [Leucocoprinus birnbaumii]|uniref:Uncharacterized protein n=1 Tax=Leucocoprinus birnbaumii TaxID=56174 RepID=A0AAD5VZW3_9AGAR|nr:hypothetical protein NP233_g1774 [Leucocoprinus birnbaumii]